MARRLLCSVLAEVSEIMQRDRMRTALQRLGIPPRDFRVLKILPLVWVAWADGTLEPTEKERILEFATAHCHLSPAGIAVLDGWLSRAPSHHYVSEALRDLYKLAVAEDDPEVDTSELPGLLALAEAIARSTATALDHPASVDESEERALEEIARELHVDRGVSWARLLKELNGSAATGTSSIAAPESTAARS